jgi:hypothetical protein
MKILLFVIFSLLIAITGCSNEDPDITPDPPPAKNESILVKTLLYTGWSSGSQIHSMTSDDFRNLMISVLESKSANSKTALQSIGDNDLSWGAMMYKFLLEAGIFSVQQLKTKSLDDYRKSIISLNSTKTGKPASQFQNNSDAQNLMVAHEWWFNENSAVRVKIDRINNVVNSDPKFNLKDNQNRVMDVLKIVKADEAYTYLGVYHAMAAGNHFKLYLAGSNDLKQWTAITELGDRAHQGDIMKWGNGYIVANEQDPVQGKNNIRTRYYSSYSDLTGNIPSKDKSIDQTFSHLAEGTPDIRVVEGSNPGSSHILIGYHYYENGIRDQQAFGILKNFSDWRTWKDVVSNYTIREMGYAGNIGSRSAFSHSGDWLLQEAQIASGDWSSWRLLLGNGAFYTNLRPTTALGSSSFANPKIAAMGNNRFVITSFMPTEGNKAGERGELIYTVTF